MTQETVVTLGQNALAVVLLTALPMLALSMIVGLTVAIFQAVTQINEMTITFIPKIAAVFVALLIFGPWIMSVMISFTTNLLVRLGEFAR